MTARTTQLGEGVQKQANLVLPPADWFFFVGAKLPACLSHLTPSALTRQFKNISSLNEAPPMNSPKFLNIQSVIFSWFSWALLICHSLFTRRPWRISTRARAIDDWYWKAKKKLLEEAISAFVSLFLTSQAAAAADYSQLFPHCSLFVFLSRISRTSSS